MAADPIVDKLAAGKVILGLGNMYPAAGIIEGMCKGWDFVFIDGQHGEMSYDACLHAVQTARGVGVCSAIRVPGHAHEYLGKYADLCPSALIVPMVSTPAEAKAVVSGIHFPPLGTRSYGGRRVIDLHGRDFYKTYKMLTIVQIETLEGVQNADAIAAMDGIDALYFGPDDMKLRMGLDIDTPVAGEPRLADAFKTMADACRKHGKYAGASAGSPAILQQLTDLGYQIFMCGGDIGFLRTASAEKLAELQKAMAGKQADDTETAHY